MNNCKVLCGPWKTVIKESLIGTTCTNQETAIFDFGNVVVQKDYFENDCVRVVSGGSYLSSEFVGKGMLTAAIQGESFMAPPSKVILRTVRELCLNSVYGALIIVPANSELLLNFGLAVERALNDDIQVKLLAVDDNYHEALPKLHRKALSGVVLVNKIAGAMSEKKITLRNIFSYCEKVVKNLISYEIILSNYYQRNNDKTCICGPNNVNIDPVTKREKIKVQDVGHTICKGVIQEILNISSEVVECTDKLNLKTDETVVVLLNNNGGLNKIEEYIFLKEFVKILETNKIVVRRFYTGNFLVCSPNIDFTVTVLKVFDGGLLGYLDDPCTAPGWIKVNQSGEHITLDNSIKGHLNKKHRLAPPIRGPKISEKMANVLLVCTQFACDALISCEKQLNMIDEERGDGDTGFRLKNASEVLLKRMRTDKIITNYPFTFFETLSKLLEATVGGSMGCIYSVLFEAAASSFIEYAEEDQVTPHMWLKALEKASDSLKRFGHIDLGDGTMFDPIYNCAKVVREQLDQGANFIEAFGRGVFAAEETAQKTKQVKCKYPDSGAHAVGIWMRAVFEGVKLRCPLD